MKIASWNVNSIRSRQVRVEQWLAHHSPDVLCLQETKVTDDAFPLAPFRALGFEPVIHGQKTYNGVAILSRVPAETVRRGFDDSEDEAGARLIGARCGPVWVYSAYVPNGQVVGSEQWGIKLRWLSRLRAVVERHHRAGDWVVVCGDFNVAPEARDVHDPEYWKTQVLFHPQAREALQNLCAAGLVDTFRLHSDAHGAYSWWDYRGLAFPRNLGLRIDLLFASKGLAARCTAAAIDRDTRKGPLPSDHALIWAEFELP